MKIYANWNTFDRNSTFIELNPLISVEERSKPAPFSDLRNWPVNFGKYRSVTSDKFRIKQFYRGKNSLRSFELF